ELYYSSTTIVCSIGDGNRRISLASDNKVQKIATHFSHSLIAQNELKQIQIERLNQSGLSILQECSTRWNSTYYMMSRILKLKDSLVLYSGTHAIPILTADEWIDLKKCITVLMPFEEITKELSSATATIASVIPLIYTLKNTLETEKYKEDTSDNFKLMITKMIQDLNIRFQDIENNKIYTIATYLDPRYKLKFFTEITKEQVRSEILEIFGCSKTSHDEGPSSSKRSRNELATTSSSNQSRIQSCLAEILSISDEEEQNIDCADEVYHQFIVKKTLLTEYNREKRLTLTEDPLLWWKNHTKYHSLSNLVRQYLSPPPGSVPSEQLFSAAGLIYDPLRNRLSGDKAAKLLFVKYNLPLLRFDY
ncbi:zinc finger BED domain-containing protein 4-like, partial [Manduca sexta]|uniref:zinc finger BED domain-containing protein 4-like n=1 Tax=Manduca sexta TaxID=7130 RepID=UPI00188EEB21